MQINTTFKDYPWHETIHSALEEKDRHMLQHIRCNAYQFYSFFFNVHIYIYYVEGNCGRIFACSAAFIIYRAHTFRMA
jgi:hypothetical protein